MHRPLVLGHAVELGEMSALSRTCLRTFVGTPRMWFTRPPLISPSANLVPRLVRKSTSEIRADLQKYRSATADPIARQRFDFGGDFVSGVKRKQGTFCTSYEGDFAKKGDSISTASPRKNSERCAASVFNEISDAGVHGEHRSVYHTS